MLGLRRNETTRRIADYAEALRDDEASRRRLGRAAKHGILARQRATRQLGLSGAAFRLATDPTLQAHLRQMLEELDSAQKRLTRRRRHRVRNTFLVLLGGGAAATVALVPAVRERLGKALGGMAPGRMGPTTVEETIEVGVPVRTAYNQWTQFEDFPLFMEGLEHVRQIDDANLHWVAKVSGRTAEWDARILQQEPDRRIAWTSTDGRDTRGTVVFEELAPERTLVRLTMAYTPQGAGEALGSAARLDRKRIRGDLERFKELIEARGEESGAWRGTVEAGGTAS